MLIGESGIARLKSAHVAVFGVGGVGSYAVEALARSGVGHISVIDADKVSESN
ncbi:MAG: ThiF family adenylyltransferase, partial [Clostridia bacterium]|nr:ThiF family adenylyltransferase [Clostridia bacterium]